MTYNRLGYLKPFGCKLTGWFSHDLFTSPVPRCGGWLRDEKHIRGARRWFCSLFDLTIIAIIPIAKLGTTLIA